MGTDLTSIIISKARIPNNTSKVVVCIASFLGIRLFRLIPEATDWNRLLPIAESSYRWAPHIKRSRTSLDKGKSHIPHHPCVYGHPDRVLPPCHLLCGRLAHQSPGREYQGLEAA